MRRFLLRHAYFIAGLLGGALMCVVTDADAFTSWRWWLGFGLVFGWGELAIYIDHARERERVWSNLWSH